MKTVLIADDAIFMRKVLGDILQKNGYEVVGEASNGREAVEKYLLLKPEFVTMDITMPVMDGVEALKVIKKIDSNCKIIMVSALGQEDMKLDCIRAGAKGYIVKPFREGDVLEQVKKLNFL
ncbi:two-component system, chemotaxis family, response regulator CheY [Anaerocolumna jejuensis DSM 15929]|uniref:Stage 0 sporulation protein A homolog n=1 Tax=Anaerocolumna jejuensis DSM 15929 TaxID=1121322 RepID=A0A1M6NQG9_9FIRM|nr:response regulator [Anaerocolumna jejuensis]SHJ97900.1 two-component system, chemotaxis family, response regulator CheY [Anaerocolumna jejuensis DSM 15929]